MKLPSISSTRVARALYNNGIQSMAILANSTKLQIEDILINSKEVTGKFFISGKALDMTVQEIAKLLIQDAQTFLKNELGLKDVKWDEDKIEEETVEASDKEEHEIYPTSINTTKRRRKDDSYMQIDSSINASYKRDTPKTKKVNMNTSVEYKKKLRSSINKHADETTEEKSNENSSLFKNSGISVSLLNVSSDADSLTNHLKIIDVLNDKKVYENFSKEIFKNQHMEVSMSVGIERIQVKALTIGGNLLKNCENEKFNFKFSDNLCISCICMSFYDSNQVYYLDLQKGINELISNSKMLLKKLLMCSDITLNVYDTREHLKILELADIQELNNVNAKIFDPRLCSWIMDPDNILFWQETVTKYSPDSNAILEFGIKYKTSSSLGLNLKNSIEPKIRSSVECFLTNKIKKGQLQSIASTPKLLKVLENLEMPIQKALAKMEQNGFPINKNKLYESIEHASKLLRQLESYIFRLNGRKFDLTSSKEIAKVVGIHKNKEKKKISTAKTVLTKIDLPIADCIIQYRTLSTTISNIQPMTNLVKNDRIYGSSFSLTQTGRISMHEPNLQNVTKDFYVEFKGET